MSGTGAVGSTRFVHSLMTAYPCKQWHECGVRGGGCCAAGHFRKPSFGVCDHCMFYDGPARGVGDHVAKLINTVTLGKIKCGGCTERRADLNAAAPTGITP